MAEDKPEDKPKAKPEPLAQQEIVHKLWTKAQGGKTEEGDEVNYEEKTVPELKELAATKGIAVPYDARKDEIIKELKKADKK